mmetsp:Transcript_11386/g.34070  ORF Transcript_11386/g.34070 Transcript_11386/m.34070 type:complete len:349 (-) Transcript_11386:88-1134(-)
MQVPKFRPFRPPAATRGEESSASRGAPKTLGPRPIAPSAQLRPKFTAGTRPRLAPFRCPYKPAQHRVVEEPDAADENAEPDDAEGVVEAVVDERARKRERKKKKKKEKKKKKKKKRRRDEDEDSDGAAADDAAAIADDEPVVDDALLDDETPAADVGALPSQSAALRKDDAPDDEAASADEAMEEPPADDDDPPPSPALRDHDENDDAPIATEAPRSRFGKAVDALLHDTTHVGQEPADKSREDVDDESQVHVDAEESEESHEDVAEQSRADAAEDSHIDLAEESPAGPGDHASCCGSAVPEREEPSGDREQPPASPTGIACTRCTFLNHPKTSYCDMCGARIRRPRR